MKYFTFFLLIIVTSSSCVTSHNYMVYKSQPDKNDRIDIKGAYWENKINPVGIGAIALGTGLGAYAGSQTNIFRGYNNESHNNNTQILNTVTGGLIGFGLSTMANYLIANQGKVKKVQDINQMNKWLNEYDHSLRPISGGYDSYRVGNIKSKSTFTAYEYADVKDFIILFGNNSDETSRFVERSIPYLNRKDLPLLLNDFKNPPRHLVMKIYIKKSTTLDEAIEANRRFPEFTSLAEEVAVKYIGNIHHLNDFLSEFKNSKYKNYLEDKGLSLVKNMHDYELFVRHYTKNNKNKNNYYQRLKPTIKSCKDLRMLFSFFDEAVNDNDLLNDIARNFKHSELLCAYEVFESNPNKKFLATIFLKDAPKISTIYRAIPYFKGLYSFEAYDNLAFEKVNNTNEANEYLIYFGKGKHTQKAKNMIDEYGKSKMNSISNISSKTDNNLIKAAYSLYRELGSYVYKPKEYQTLANIIEPVLSEYAAMYDLLLESNDQFGQLMVMEFETKEDVPAFIYLEEVVDKVQQVDIFNPWISSIYGYGSKANKGLIYGRYCCPALLSGIDFARFKGRVKPDVEKNIDIIRYDSHYAGNLFGEIFRASVRNFLNLREEEKMSGSLRDAINCYNPLSSNYEIYCNERVEIIRIMCNSQVKEFYYGDKPLNKGCNQPAQRTGYYQASIFSHPFISEDYNEVLRILCNCR